MAFHNNVIVELHALYYSKNSQQRSKGKKGITDFEIMISIDSNKNMRQIKTKYKTTHNQCTHLE